MNIENEIYPSKHLIKVDKFTLFLCYVYEIS
jgi:hypothetical protein